MSLALTVGFIYLAVARIRGGEIACDVVGHRSVSPPARCLRLCGQIDPYLDLKQLQLAGHGAFERSEHALDGLVAQHKRRQLLLVGEARAGATTSLADVAKVFSSMLPQGGMLIFLSITGLAVKLV
jgi:hypothetical protein